MKNWVCPESGDMYEKPGPCPDCGVTLVPLEHELSEDEKIAYCAGWWDALEAQRNRISANSNQITLREAAQQALEAMEYNGMDVGKFNRINAACQALRAAIAKVDGTK